MYDFSKEACKGNVEKQIIRLALLNISGLKLFELAQYYQCEELKNMTSSQLSDKIMNLLSCADF